MSAPTVVVTGASGFIGRWVCRRLAAEGYRVRAISRRPLPELPVEVVDAGDLEAAGDLFPLLAGAAAVVHLAGRAHVLREHASDPEAAFRRANLELTERLAQATVRAGVGRFVFMSSIGAIGQLADAPLAETAPAKPVNAYGRSKLAAEQALTAATAGTGTRYTILRPPLVYGPEAPGNFGLLTRAVRKGWPLPLGAVRNLRGLVFVENLADVVAAVLRSEMAADQVFHVADAELSTPELVSRMARALGRPARLWPLPPALLSFAGRLLGRQAAVNGLAGSLRLDTRKLRDVLNWTPPVSLDDAIARSLRGAAG